MIFRHDNESRDRLAGIFSGNPEMYNYYKTVLNDVKGKAILARDAEGGLEADIKFVDEANSLARNSDYFIFEVDDTYTDCCGFKVYQKVGEKMVLVSDHMAPENFEEIVEFLHENKIKKCFTAYVPSEGYFGIRDDFDESCGHSVEYAPVSISTDFPRNDDGVTVRDFKEKGIDVILLNY